MKYVDAFRIYTLPEGVVLYMSGIGNQNVLYCGKDGEGVPFPKQLGLYSSRSRTSRTEAVCTRGRSTGSSGRARSS